MDGGDIAVGANDCGSGGSSVGLLRVGGAEFKTFMPTPAPSVCSTSNNDCGGAFTRGTSGNGHVCSVGRAGGGHLRGGVHGTGEVGRDAATGCGGIGEGAMDSGGTNGG